MVFIKMRRFFCLILIYVAYCYAERNIKIDKNYRIVNGKNADIEDFPFQLSLRRKTVHICGASILKNDWAITAAHCVHDMEHSPRDITLRMGSKWRTKNGAVVTVRQINCHPSYNPDTFNFDVALLKVSPKAFDRFELHIKPINLPAPSEEITDNTAATVSGWGYQSSTEHNLSNELKYTTVYTVNQNHCNNSLLSHGGITNAMFCATARSTDACQGDSGGPIQIDGILVGVVSWGVGCANPYYPGVYARLSYVPIRLWIKMLTKL